MTVHSFAAARAKMVAKQLRARGIRDPRVCRAMGAVPREDFLPAEYVDRAYADGAVAIGCDQTISQPYMVAAMTEALTLNTDAHVLEVGTGSGYQAAVLSHLAGDVTSIERIPELAIAARARLNRLGVANVTVVEGDGSAGWPAGAPYDAIIVTAAAPRVPPALSEQLADGGRFVIPVGTRRQQMCMVITRQGAALETRELIACVFVPLLGAQGWEA